MFYPQRLMIARWENAYRQGAFNKKYQSLGQKLKAIAKRKLVDSKAKKSAHKIRMSH